MVDFVVILYFGKMYMYIFSYAIKWIAIVNIERCVRWGVCVWEKEKKKKRRKKKKEGKHFGS